MTVAVTLIGGLVGAAIGALVGRSGVCGSGQCDMRNRLIPAVIGGAVLGAAVGYWLATR